MPTIRFDATLVETVITATVQQHGDGSNPEFAKRYYRETNTLYEQVPLNERGHAFEALHTRLFNELDFGQAFVSAYSEVPPLLALGPSALILLARGRHEEGAVLGRDGESICLRLPRALLTHSAQLAPFVRHELWHAADMLDPHFGYQVVARDTFGATNRLADRYRVLWCSYVDARIVRGGLEPLASQEVHRQEVATYFVALPATEQTRLFDAIWDATTLTQADIVALADEADKGRQQHGAQPGARCPLCRFPTYCWTAEIPAPLAAAIQADFPAWQPYDGVCERCAEAYLLRV